MTTIRHALSAKAPASKVRAALTSSEGITGWWAKDADIGSGPGAKHELRFLKNGNKVIMNFVVDTDSEREVAWTCTDNANPIWKGTKLAWQLSANGDSTSIVFSHSGFAEGGSPPYQMTVDGWEHFVESLRLYLETGVGQPW